MRHRAGRLLALVVGLAVLAGPAFAQEGRRSAALRDWLKKYDDAFNARDVRQLEAFYHPDVTIFEGGGVDRGWIAYRDQHLGPELKGFENLQFAHSNVQVHMLNESAALVTSEYSLKARVKGQPVDSGGLETLLVIRMPDGNWKIRHSHTSSRRRPAPRG